MKFSKHKLGDLGKIITGKTPSTSNLALWNGDIQFVTPEDLQKGKNILQTERYLTQEGVKSVCGAFIPAESVCVSCIGNIGYVAKTIYPCVTNQQINTIVPSNEQSPDFLYYKLKSIWNYFKLREGNATTIPILSKSDFSNIEIHLPDLPTQLRIAAIIFNTRSEGCRADIVRIAHRSSISVNRFSISSTVGIMPLTVFGANLNNSYSKLETGCFQFPDGIA